MKKSKKEKMNRDYNILLSMKGEINLRCSSLKSNKAYSRKTKHKGKQYDS